MSINWFEPRRGVGRTSAFFGITVGAANVTVRLSTEAMEAAGFAAGDSLRVGLDEGSLYLTKGAPGYKLAAYVGEGESRKDARGEVRSAFIRMPLTAAFQDISSASFESDEVAFEDGMVSVDV